MVSLHLERQSMPPPAYASPRGSLSTHLRATPGQATTEMAGIVLLVAEAAQWCELPLSRTLVWDPVDGIAVMAEPPCVNPAIDAWPVKECRACEPGVQVGVPRLLVQEVQESVNARVVDAVGVGFCC